MSKKILPQVPSEVSIDALDPASRARLERAEAAAEADRKRHKGDRRCWSKEGTVCAELQLREPRDELLQPALENHDYNHRLFRDFPCSPRCRARDLWATFRLYVKAIAPSRDWPIRRVLALVVKEATGYFIKEPPNFAYQVGRDLNRLATALATSRRHRTTAQRRLVATYNVTGQLSAFATQYAFIGAGDIDKK
jgi:hypothetical protein